MSANDSKVIVDSRRQSEWIVPRRVMCAFFWVGIILVFTGIILLVTSKHKTAQTLYTSTGAILLGLGFCLLLVCLILCMHAYCVITVAEEQPQMRRHVPPPTPPIANGRKPGQNRPNEGTKLLPKHVGGKPVQLIIIEKEDGATVLAAKPPTGKPKSDIPHSPNTSGRSSDSSGKFVVQTEDPPLYSVVSPKGKHFMPNQTNGSAITPNGPVRHPVQPRSQLTPPRYGMNRLTPPKEEEEEEEFNDGGSLQNKLETQQPIQPHPEAHTHGTTPPLAQEDSLLLTNPTDAKIQAPTPSAESPYHFQPIKSKGTNLSQATPVRMTTVPQAPPQKAQISGAILEEEEEEDYDDTPPPIPPRNTSVTQSRTSSSIVTSAPHALHGQLPLSTEPSEGIITGDMYLGSTKHISGGANPHHPLSRTPITAEVYQVAAMPQSNPYQGSMYVTPVTSIENHYSTSTSDPSVLTLGEQLAPSFHQTMPGASSFPASPISPGETVARSDVFPAQMPLENLNQESVVFIGPNSELTASKISVYDNVQYVWTDTPPTKTMYRPLQRQQQKYTF